MDTLDLRERAGTSPSPAQRQDANENAQIRLRRALFILRGFQGAILCDLEAVIDGEADRSVRSAAEDVRAGLEVAISDARTALEWAVDACGGHEVHELPRAAARAMED